MQKLIPALIQAKQQFKPIAKDRVNTFFNKAKYATLDSVNEAVNDALASNGLAVTQLVSTQDGKPVLLSILYHESGENIQSVYPLPENLVSEPQKLGAAITYARRYAKCALLDITADEDDDGNATNPQHKQQSNGNGNKPSTNSIGSQPKNTTKSGYITIEQANDLYKEAMAAGHTPQTLLKVFSPEEYPGEKWREKLGHIKAEDLYKYSGIVSDKEYVGKLRNELIKDYVRANGLEADDVVRLKLSQGWSEFSDPSGDVFGNWLKTISTPEFVAEFKKAKEQAQTVDVTPEPVAEKPKRAKKAQPTPVEPEPESSEDDEVDF